MPRLIQSCLFLLVLLVLNFPAVAQDSSTSRPDTSSPVTVVPPPPPSNFDELIDRVVEREHQLAEQMRNMRPMVETYVQNLKPDAGGKLSPVSDQYLLGRLDMSDGPQNISFTGQPGFGRKKLMTKLVGNMYSLHLEPQGFTQMIIPDTEFYKKYYAFNFVRREFLGEVRCLAIDVQPKPDAPPGRFEGRIWVEDRGYTIIRFNGTYSRAHMNTFYFHFDSWRLNLRPGVWLPAYVYSEESEMETSGGKVNLKAQTRLWGYDLRALAKSRNEEFAQIMVDSQDPVKDQSAVASDPTPVMAERMWERQAEDNVVERLQNVGLLAPPGDVDRVLQTVVNNLIASNNLDLQADIRCRILLTAPLESFAVGHTIVVSRGLLDVLPDEASLAMVLAHELSHIALGHHFDTRMAFNDRMFFPDDQSFKKLDFKSRPGDEAAADEKALELLKNSPYKEKLASVGLFLRALQESAPELPNLIRAHIGNPIAAPKGIRMAALLPSAPQLDPQRIDQIAALPLGGRIKLDPWTDQVELEKARPVPLALAKENMPFEITPFFPYETRLSQETVDKALNGGSL
jgi:hypothetical protein